MTTVIERTAYVDGGWIDPEGRQLKEHYSPLDSSILVGRSLQLTAADVDLAVQAAGLALPGWAGLSGGERGAYLFKAAQKIEEHAQELADLLTLEMGKPIGEARGEVNRAVVLLRYYAGEGLRSVGEVLPATDGVSHLYTTRVPLGVVGLITPWNFPAAIPVWKMAPALIFGNTVVWKPAEHATITASYLMQLLEASGLPRGIVQLVSGSGSVVGQRMLEHPGITGISFTGSDAVGRTVAQAASARHAKYQLEMGGKNASVVLADADLGRAADTIISAAMRSAGQKCTATSRVIVEKSVKAELTALLVERAQRIKLSDPREGDCYLGPVVSKRQYDSILGMVEQGIREGARLLAGGRARTEGGFGKGYYIEPTILDGVAPNSLLAQEEIFGPVLVILEADDLEHAIELANHVRYGLAAALFTQSQKSIHRFVNAIEAGLIKINGETAGVEPQAPFGGMKLSSSYSREQGRAAIEFFTQVKTVAVTP
ncbi:aldehyde dehydrogenase family protein [Paenibacillus mucilaginosus]|uniref:Aldehyde dehydrogenase n=1 Tax=Paenibacillus mucilaginosus (strain KNP414) TaxID=1036673 RepID=F8FKD7_PAEMK|nr:aldehyde dehydrogenase family protein [Paenibacillus mucilaginosus]AEI44818.1 aldehyde dehydrogenase [Paenibacillus mucilaginosus KNP414]MCG7214865.1 aldehyde dehydrogenase family protein [Paenibacillus mucilaginosus]WDM26345.1 aldehyde dehydrogenase family protein [Paenibacillus mucilaginosus]